MSQSDRSGPPSVRRWLFVGEWIVTILFTIEYVARLLAVQRPLL